MISNRFAVNDVDHAAARSTSITIPRGHASNLGPPFRLQSAETGTRGGILVTILLALFMITLIIIFSAGQPALRVARPLLPGLALPSLLRRG